MLHHHDDDDSKMPPTLPPKPDAGAPATLETLLAEIRYSRAVDEHLVYQTRTLTNRLNEVLPALSTLGERTYTLERAMGAASHAMDLPLRRELTLPNGDAG